MIGLSLIFFPLLSLQADLALDIELADGRELVMVGEPLRHAHVKILYHGTLLEQFVRSRRILSLFFAAVPSDWPDKTDMPVCSVSFSSGPTGDAFTIFGIIASLPNLMFLEIEMPPLGTDHDVIWSSLCGYLQARGGPMLESLRLFNVFLTQSRAGQLARNIMTRLIHSLNFLEIGQNGDFNDEAAALIVTSLSGTQRLKNLRLTSVGRPPKTGLTAAALASLLRLNDSITTLEVACAESEEKASHIAPLVHAIRSNRRSSISKLQIWGDITTYAAISLISLVECPQIGSLYFNINDAASAVRPLPHLQSPSPPPHHHLSHSVSSVQALAVALSSRPKRRGPLLVNYPEGRQNKPPISTTTLGALRMVHQSSSMLQLEFLTTDQDKAKNQEAKVCFCCNPA